MISERYYLNYFTENILENENFENRDSKLILVGLPVPEYLRERIRRMMELISERIQRFKRVTIVYSTNLGSTTKLQLEIKGEKN